MPKRKVIWTCHICGQTGKSKSKQLSRMQSKHHYKKYHPDEWWGNATVREIKVNQWGRNCNQGDE